MTAKECYKRGKLLKLKKISEQESRAISKSLLLDQKSNINEKKVEIALKRFVDQKLEIEKKISKETVQPYLDYIQRICEEYQEFRKTEDNLVLFGGELELADIKRSVEGGTTA